MLRHQSERRVPHKENRKISKAAKAFIAIGLTGVSYIGVEITQRDKAQAEGCFIPDHNGDLMWYDPCPGSTPTPSQPNNNQPPIKPSPTTTTIPYSEKHNDNDGINNGSDNCDTIDNPDQLNFDGDLDGDVCDDDDDNDTYPDTFDFDPFSPGIGEPAIEFGEALGYDASDSQTYFALISTDPASWEGRQLKKIPTTTTTTVTNTTNTPVITSPVSTEVTPTTAAINTSTTIDKLGDEVVSSSNSTLPEMVSAGIDDGDNQRRGGSSMYVFGVFAILSSLFLGGVLVRKRHENTTEPKDQQPTPITSIDHSPVAGN